MYNALLYAGAIFSDLRMFLEILQYRLIVTKQNVKNWILI